MKICFASQNKHKIEELNQLLDGIHHIVGLQELGIQEEIPETGATFAENATIKSRYVYDRFNLPVFADDSGLCVNALDGEPGVYSARYAGPDKNDEKNIDLLLQKLGNSQNRSAYFMTVISYIDDHGQEFQFSGQVDGEILPHRVGKNGFGYDPIFKPKGYTISFAEMDSKEKNTISHRGLAVQKLINHLSKNG